MYALTIESDNSESFQKILWMLEHFESDGINIIKENDFKDLQLIKEGRKEKQAQPLDAFLKSVENER